ncbi:MAG: DUF4235 domain-containing protein [Nitriliruptoraceae bacterium]
MQALLRRIIAAGAAAAAAVAARKAVEVGWGLAHDGAPPTAADVQGDADLRDLLLWSALVAGAVVVARKLATSRAEQLFGGDDEG